MDESIAVEPTEGALGRPYQESARSSLESRRGPRPRDLPDARSAVRDGTGHRPQARRYDRPSTPRDPGRPAGLDPGRQHDLPVRDPRNAAAARPPWPHPRDEERREAQTERPGGPRFGL